MRVIPRRARKSTAASASRCHVQPNDSGRPVLEPSPRASYRRTPKPCRASIVARDSIPPARVAAGAVHEQDDGAVPRRHVPRGELHAVARPQRHVPVRDRELHRRDRHRLLVDEVHGDRERHHDEEGGERRAREHGGAREPAADGRTGPPSGGGGSRRRGRAARARRAREQAGDVVGRDPRRHGGGARRGGRRRRGRSRRRRTRSRPARTGRSRRKPSATATATASGTPIVARLAPREVPAGGAKTPSVSRCRTIAAVAIAYRRAA